MLSHAPGVCSMKFIVLTVVSQLYGIGNVLLQCAATWPRNTSFNSSLTASRHKQEDRMQIISWRCGFLLKHCKACWRHRLSLFVHHSVYRRVVHPAEISLSWQPSVGSASKAADELLATLQLHAAKCSHVLTELITVICSGITTGCS